jgi:hypothetical protein
MPTAVDEQRLTCSQGHEVYGTTRSAEKAPKLAAEEIVPIIGDAWQQQAADFDAIVECATAGPHGYDYLNIAAAASKSRGKHYPINYIYSSGMWNHGDFSKRNYGLNDERQPPKTPAELVRVVGSFRDRTSADS